MWVRPEFQWSGQAGFGPCITGTGTMSIFRPVGAIVLDITETLAIDKPAVAELILLVANPSLVNTDMMYT